MSLSTYRKALRLGLKDRKSAGSDTLATLDENKLDLAYREPLGLLDIPMDLIAGTLTEGRAVSFPRTSSQSWKNPVNLPPNGLP